MKRMTPERFRSNLTARPEIVGTPSLLGHFVEHTSSQRGQMVGSHMAQIDTILHPEPARIQTGFEQKYGRYTFNDSRRDQDIQVMKVIPRFALSASGVGITRNPSYTVIYIGADDNRIGYFNLSSYTMLHDGFGYLNKRTTSVFPSEGDFIPKETQFHASPNHDGTCYNLGVNANVCYMPMWDTTDDAFIISRSLSEKLEHTVVKSVTITVPPDTIPLNLYGDDTVYNCFPNIGSHVREDGILLALRKRDKNTFLTDLTATELCTPRTMHDDIYRAEPGAEILDVQVFVNHACFNKAKMDTSNAQILEYQNLHNRYYAQIIQAYDELTEQHYKCSPSFANLVTRCKAFCYYRGGNKLVLVDKKEEIQFARIQITYAYTRKVSFGNKLTGFEGSKGVVASIWEDEDMPVGPYGVRADMIVTPESPFNRLNGGQFYEQFISLCCHVVQKAIVEGTVPADKACDYALEFIREVQPMYAEKIEEVVKGNGLEEEFVEAIKESGIHLVIPPFCDSVTPDMVVRLSEKYGITRGPLTYHRKRPDGTREEIVTKCDGIIGERYIILLAKRPDDQINVVEFGYVNQFTTPMKPNSRIAKAQSLSGQTPLRLGEDEIAILICVIGSEATARLTGVYSNSTVALRQLNRCLLMDEHPSALKNIGMTTKEVVDSSANIGLFKHQFAETGFVLTQEGEQP